MSENMNRNLPDNIDIMGMSSELTAGASAILQNAKTDLVGKQMISVPIAQLTTLGAGVSCLIPALQTVSQTTVVNAQGLYQLANADVGDVLKVAKNGNFWGAFKTAEGSSKFAQLKSADPLSATTSMALPINPAAMLMAVSLFVIEQQLGSIAKMEREILSFLELEQETKIEADIETLSSMLIKYKHNWDNEYFISSSHKMALDIQRSAHEHMNFYQKKISEALNAKQWVVAQSKVAAALSDLLKKFKYYRLSLYIFSLSSLVEVMLSGNFKEEYILSVATEIRNYSMTYRDLFGKCSVYLEKLSDAAFEKQILKGIGSASRTVGKLIGSIPVVKNGPVDEFLQDKGIRLRQSADSMEKDIVEAFAEISNPETSVFLEKMQDMIRIYNHTKEIYFDQKQIYLITESKFI